MRVSLGINNNLSYICGQYPNPPSE
jgi:hypothetical protein